MKNDPTSLQVKESRFATEEEVFSPEFARINEELLVLQAKHNLLDQSELNAQRFQWASMISSRPIYYASRMWEYPFAILSADIVPGMIVADVGCGNTPFTAYLAKLLGPKNVFGYDPDIAMSEGIGHSHFGAKTAYFDELGINFFQDNIQKLTAVDDAFDVVFCLSVLEHIENSFHKLQGIKEMARTVKPGGKLILTFDIGINLPLNHIWDIIASSGLTPLGINLSWPKKRFVNYGGSSSVDVFGLVLHKTNEYIYSDCNENATIPAVVANKKMQDKTIFYSLSYSEILAAHDLELPYGWAKVMIKKILKRY